MNVTVLAMRIWSDVGSVVKIEGVPSDMEVDQTVATVFTGHDPQLEAAIRVVLEDLGKSELQEPKRPSSGTHM